MKKFILISIVTLLLLHGMRDVLVNTLDSTSTQKNDWTEEISYQLLGDTLSIEIPFNIPYANQHSINNQNNELVLVHQGDYYKVFSSVFTGDKLKNTAVKINPTKQEIFQILGQLLVIDERQTEDPFDPVRALSSSFAKYFCVVPFSYIHWVWTDVIRPKHTFVSLFFTDTHLQLTSPPPRLN